METTSVYMCFPCYQEFDTLEEVLQHQLTCTAEEDQPSSSGADASGVPQLEAHSLYPSVQNIKKELEEGAETEKQSSDQPRILYQCGDCDKLFKSLPEWQQHRKEGTCENAASKSAADPNAETEISLDENQAASVNPDDSSLPLGKSSNALTPEEEEIPEEETAEVPAAEASASQTSDGLAAEAPASDDSSPRRRGIAKKPKPEPVLLCVDCGSCFGLVSELVSHRKTQHGFEEALHRCSVCGESFLNTTLFLYHRKQHRQKGEETVAVVPEATPKVFALNNGSQMQDALSSSDDAAAAPAFTQPESFFCTLCGQSFGDGKGLATHRKESHGISEPLHTCPHCGEGFMNTTQFLYHRQQHRCSPPRRATRVLPLLRGAALRNKASKDDSEGSAAADTNNTNQPPPAKLLQDWSRTPLPHVCPYCGKTFTRRVFLRSHVYSHTGEKLFTCKVCTKSFTNSQSLLRHSMNHTGSKPFCCDVCGKSFSQATTLKRHQLIHTSTEPPRKRGRKPDMDASASLFACPNCPSHFSTEEQLNDHRLLHTSHPFPCPECGEPFKRRKDLDLHSLIHQDKQPVSCPHCSSQFINQSVLDIHLQRCPVTEEERNTGRGRGQGRGRSTGQVGTFSFQITSIRFESLCWPVSDRMLRSHRTKSSLCSQTELNSPSLPKLFLQCATCGKRFRQLPHLQDHERIHTGLRPFCCWICGKSFSVAARLTEHARTHSGEKPYPCPHCSAAFRSRPNLDKHLRQHKDLPPEAAEQVVHAAEVAHVQKVLEGAKALSTLTTTTELDAGTVVILPSSVLGGQTITVPTITMGESEITMVETSQSPQHAIEFIVEETV
uniref:Zinc finger protein 574 n=1 Tax=Fundulus heteroclitus TaxID=8078 RepID=A0A3Q2P8M0_FUNHE